jgi:hypothetical protein
MEWVRCICRKWTDLTRPKPKVTGEDAALFNVLRDGIVKEVNQAWDRRALRATLILVYSGIDAMAYLTMPAAKDRVTRADFVSWADQYLRFRDAARNPTLSIPGLELYAARCGVVHTYSTEADLHKQGVVKRQIGYGDEFLPEVKADPANDALVMLSIRGLVDAFTMGVANTLRDLKTDEPKRKVFAARLQRMVQELPYQG